MAIKNKRAVKGNDWKFFFGVVVSIILVAVLVVAINLGATPGVSIVINDSDNLLMNGSFAEDTEWIMNISINNTFNASSPNANITEVNITLPSGFNFTVGSNITNSTTAGLIMMTNFSSNGTLGQSPSVIAGVLKWMNDTTNGAVVMINSSINVSTYFMFNITVATPGIWNMTIRWRNGTTAGTENITLVINDSTAPHSVNWSSVTPANYSNNSVTGIEANVTFSDNWDSNVVAVTGTTSNGINSSSVNITLYNADQVLINSSVATGINTNKFYYVNFTNSTGLAEGVYYINATVQDAGGNKNWSFGSYNKRKIILDRTAPTVTFSCTPTTLNPGEVITCDCGSNDSYSLGVASTSGSVTTTYNISTTAVSSGTQSCTVTDRADNVKTASVAYTVRASNVVGSSSGTSWTGGTVAVVTEEQFEEGITKELKVKDRAKVMVGSTYHYVGVTKISGEVVTIEISSDPITANLIVGQIRRFDVDGDDVYDIQVTLNKITDGKADVTILSIDTAVTEGTKTEETLLENTALGAEGGETGETGETGTGTGEEEGKPMAWWIWVVIGVVVVLIIVVGGFAMKKK